MKKSYTNRKESLNLFADSILRDVSDDLLDFLNAVSVSAPSKAVNNVLSFAACYDCVESKTVGVIDVVRN